MSFLNRIKWGAVVLGIILILGGGYDCYRAHQPVVDLYSLSESDIKAGKMVEADIWCNLGVYEESYDTNYGVKQKSSEYWYYVIPVLEDKCMGVAVKADILGQAFDIQTQQTYDWLDSDTAPEPTSHYVKGLLVKMDKEDQKYFTQALVEGGYTQAEAQQLTVPFYVKNTSFDGYMTLILLGVVIMGVGIALVVITKNRN